MDFLHDVVFSVQPESKHFTCPFYINQSHCRLHHKTVLLFFFSLEKRCLGTFSIHSISSDSSNGGKEWYNLAYIHMRNVDELTFSILKSQLKCLDRSGEMMLCSPTKVKPDGSVASSTSWHLDHPLKIRNCTVQAAFNRFCGHVFAVKRFA